MKIKKKILIVSTLLLSFGYITQVIAAGGGHGGSGSSTSGQSGSGKTGSGSQGKN
ncbi:hypothetical protein [Fluviispira sanaruensis]|uniref:Uncharacterized protein n=1 Tax=Fluviispira sanaruensis TaxID=2493639 RepID=A0A4P2VI25_FLUSA|nr:hypothetical protein [Fluviispira sanaruensis]BBH52646.1 hypothetical protein JCM31447_10870 [Fluviispira sanaruensis]